jgi:hypothetical protein
MVAIIFVPNILDHRRGINGVTAGSHSVHRIVRTFHFGKIE